jgi:hypothetical protein
MESYRHQIGQNRLKFPVQHKPSRHIITVTLGLFTQYSRRFAHTHKTYAQWLMGSVWWVLNNRRAKSRERKAAILASGKMRLFIRYVQKNL